MPRLLIGALVAVLLTAPQVYAQEEHAQEESDGRVDAVHHVLDAYYVDLSPIAVIGLPRLFLVEEPDGSWDIDAFASTSTAVASGQYHPVGEGHGEAAAAIVPVKGDLLLDFSVSRHVVFELIVAILLGLIFISLARSYARGEGRESAPKGTWKNMWEVMVIYVRDEIAKPTLGHHYKTYMPYLLSIFFFVLFGNLFGLVPFGSTVTANITVTATLAGFTFVITQFSGTKEYWKHIFWPPGPLFVKPLMIPSEILGLFTKPFALAIRLFANMVGGHLVLINVIGLIFLFTALFGAIAGWGAVVFSTVFALFLYGLEVLVAFIQAYVFAILSALYFGMAIVEHHEDEHAYDEELAGKERAEEVRRGQVSGDGRKETPQSAVEPAPVAGGGYG